MSRKEKSTASVGSKKQTIRGSNWGEKETDDLLDAAQDVQTRKSKYGFNFKDSEVKEIYEIYSKKMGPDGSKWVDMDSTRKPPNIGFRLKVLRREFLVCHELATQSGWNWNEAKHQPLAPNEEELNNAIETKGEKAKWLREKKFPWYKKMEKMFGGQSARGERLKNTEDEPQPLMLLLPGKPSVPTSEQGSSDEPDEFSIDNDSIESARHGKAYAGSASKQGASSSSNKRKSTDESGEDNSRRTKYKEANRRRQAGLLNIAEAGFQIATEMRVKNEIMRARNEQVYSKEQQEDLCIEKLESLGITDASRDYCINVISNDKGRMKWILRSSETKIIEWLNRTDLFNNKQHATNEPQGYSALFTQSGPTGQPPHHGQGPHHGQPPQHGTTYFGDYNHYGSFGPSEQPPNY